MNINVVIPIEHLIIFYSILAIMFGLIFALGKWSDFVENYKFKELIYKSKKTKINIFIILSVLGAIFMPVIVLVDTFTSIKELIKEFKHNYNKEVTK